MASRKPAPPAPATTSARLGGGRLARKRTGAEVRQLTCYLPDAVHRALRLRAAEEDRPMSDCAAALLAEALGVKP